MHRWGRVARGGKYLGYCGGDHMEDEDKVKYSDDKNRVFVSIVTNLVLRQAWSDGGCSNQQERTVKRRVLAI